MKHSLKILPLLLASLIIFGLPSCAPKLVDPLSMRLEEVDKEKAKFPPDEDELTRTRKLRRKFLEDKYKTFISAIYNGENEFQAKVPVKYQDGRTASLNATVYVNDVF